MLVQLKRRREQMRLSQQALAARVGISRQALGAIESGRQNPSVAIALALASTLFCSVEDLFALDSGATIQAELAPSLASLFDRESDPPADGAPHRAPAPWPRPTARVSVGQVAGRWVAHRLGGNDYSAADGIAAEGDAPVSAVDLFAGVQSLAGNALVAGCAPLLSTLGRAVGDRFRDVRMRWIRASSARSLKLLRDGHVHIAGIHLIDECADDRNSAVVGARFGHMGALIVNLIAWRQGLLVAKGNPLGLSTTDLVRPGLRTVWREPGASAHQLLARTLARAGVSAERLPTGSWADGHVDVARAVVSGAADVGVAIEAVAAAFDLDFIPLSQERFDLVLVGADAEKPAVQRILDTVDTSAFRRQAAAFGGYSTAFTGQATFISDSAEEHL